MKQNPFPKEEIFLRPRRIRLWRKLTFTYMVFTKKHIKHMKAHLFIGMLVFVFELGVPHVSLAAEAKYENLGNIEDSVVSTTTIEDFLHSDLLDKEEKIFQSYVEEHQEHLPLETGIPRVIAERWVTTTAYSSEPHQTDGTPFTTAWITPVRDGVVAANFLPLGTLVRFPDDFGDKIFIVEDRMNVRYKYRVDIWMPKTATARRFGVQYLRMEVLSLRYPRDYVLDKFEPAFPGRK